MKHSGVLLALICACTYCHPSCNESVVQYHRQPGPEITGDYSRQYLHSDKTGKMYADPIYYDARIQELRWRQKHGPIQTTINGNGLKK